MKKTLIALAVMYVCGYRPPRKPMLHIYADIYREERFAFAA